LIWAVSALTTEAWRISQAAVDTRPGPAGARFRQPRLPQRFPKTKRENKAPDDIDKYHFSIVEHLINTQRFEKVASRWSDLPATRSNSWIGPVALDRPIQECLHPLVNLPAQTRTLADLSIELATRVQVLFYADAADVLRKAMVG
jgi:hypothetical protein